MRSKRFRMILDMTMIVLLPVLMAYSLVGEELHEYLGIAMFVLFVTHHILNYKWFKNLFRGKYNAQRIFRTIVDCLLLIYMILQPISGIMMSKHILVGVSFDGGYMAFRTIHLAFAYWGYILLCLHAGTHMSAAFARLKNNKRAFLTVNTVLSVIGIYGVFAFFKRGFPSYMFLINMFAFFDTDEAIIFFFLDYIAIMVLFAYAGLMLCRLLGREEQKEKRKKEA